MAVGRNDGQQSHQEGTQLAAGYVRYSDPGQDHASSRDLDTQIENVREHCENRGLGLDEIYKDVMTGRNVDRREYHELLDVIGTGEYDVLVTSGVGRFGRDKDGLSVAYLVQKARQSGTTVQTTRGAEFDMEDRWDRALFKMLGIVAELEVGSIQARAMEGKRVGAQEGYWVTGPAPAGYETKGPQGQKVLVPNDAAPLVREVFERYAGGASQRGLADWTGSIQDEPGGEDLPVSMGGVGRILRSRVYQGKITWKGETYEGQHDGIVSEALWEAAQDMREGRRRTYQCWDKGLDDDGENGSG